MTRDIILRLLSCMIVVISLLYILYVLRSSTKKGSVIIPYSLKVLAPDGKVKELYELMFEDALERIKKLEKELGVDIVDCCNLPLYKFIIYFKIRRKLREKSPILKCIINDFCKLVKLYSIEEINEEYGLIYERLIRHIGELG